MTKLPERPGIGTAVLLRLMSFTFLFFFCAGKVYADNTGLITLKANRKTIEQIIESLKSQYSVSFVMSSDDVDIKKVISLDVKNQPLRVVVEKIFSGENVTVSVRDNRVHVRKNPSGEQLVVDNPTPVRIITGKITDMSGNPVLGAGIVVKGTATGVTSRVDGTFSIIVDKDFPGAVLVVSYLGMKTKEVAVGVNNELGNIVLSDDSQVIEDVVVVGYGIRQKATLTGSVSSISGEEITKSPAVNLTQSLSGRLAGLIINSRSGEPGADNPSVYTRGLGSANNNDVLFIIDGVERIGFGQLNPYDIETITVLKDAEAAIYGARAANGVIVVTTKRGKGSKPTVNFSFNQGFSQPTRNPRMADSYTYATVANELETIRHTDPSTDPSLPYTREEIEKYRLGGDPAYPDTDWYKFLVRTVTPQHRSNISVRGAGDRSAYYLSFGELYQNGQYKNGSLRYRQYNFRSNVDVRVSDNFRMGMDLAGKFEDRHSPLYSSYDLNSHIFLYWPNQMPYWPGTGYLKPLRDNDNILNWVNDNAGWQKSKAKSFEGSLFFKWDLGWIEGLSLEGRGTYDAAQIFRKTFQTPSYVYYKNTDTGELYEALSGRSLEKAALTDYTLLGHSSYFMGKVNYVRSTGHHSIDAFAGYEQTRSNMNHLAAARTDFPSATLPELNLGSADKDKHSNGGYSTPFARQNYFGRFNYTYRQKYTGQVTMRADGSSNFRKGNRFGYFPSISFGWRISREGFMDAVEFVNDLKLRSSWGRMGNDNVEPFQYLVTYEYGGNYVIGRNDVPGLGEGVVPNPDITWETSSTWNVGIDATLFQGSLALEFDCFRSKRSDILFYRNATVPSYTGIALPRENIGKVLNRGFELQLMHSNRAGEFTYSIAGNFNFARNKILFIDEVPYSESYQLSTGRPLFTGLYYQAIGIFRDEEQLNSYPHLSETGVGDIIYRDVNGDGVLDSKDMVRARYTNIPEITFGLNIALGLRNFDISILFQGQENVQQYFGSDGFIGAMDHTFGNFLRWRSDGRWIPGADNSNATMPRARTGWTNVNTLNSSTHWLVDAGFLRLKNLEVGYNIPRKVCGKIGIGSARFSVSGSNLLLVYDHMKKMGFDPETSSLWYYPLQRVYSLGVSITF